MYKPCVKDSANRNIPFYKSATIAYIRWDAPAARLVVTFRQGEQYAYDNFSKKDFSGLLKEKNKTSYILSTVKEKHPCTYVTTIAPDIIKNITTPPSVKRWLST